jgi:hypothetical protein
MRDSEVRLLSLENEGEGLEVLGFLIFYVLG